MREVYCLNSQPGLLWWTRMGLPWLDFDGNRMRDERQNDPLSRREIHHIHSEERQVDSKKRMLVEYLERMLKD